ncbi:MAG: protocatechuate 3,4-dioxygenase subunit alpha, partial [Gammaproteobacteria bacterium]
ADPLEPGPAARVVLNGRVLDGEEEPIADAVLEFWQADSAGDYLVPPARSHSRGFLRVFTDADGCFRLTSIKPGPVREVNGSIQAPHLAVTILMRGLLRRVTSRVYFPDEPANAYDPILNQVPSERRGTLIAHATTGDTLHWDIHMQGPHETVFFEF